ncbi:adenylosuccinate lyase [Demetria terragena]|uniref:adenylosuccinate lyase n=1 Tax=Demetria terragena TaxID=63959 RepID=UPI000374607E|nr:adenylosuccinate lyase [Demetria terragena]
MRSLADVQPSIALGALDGRYRSAVAPLVDHLSEAALNRRRVHVEVEWLIHLTDAGVVPGVRSLTADEQAALRQVVEDFGAEDIAELADIERETVHDVKAVEYYLKRRLDTIVGSDSDGLGELIHFGCTSEDINNTSYALMVRGALEQVWLPKARTLVEQIAAMARDLREIPMLSRTHGQAATPTTLGKELAVLAHRLDRQLRRLSQQDYLAKMSGATGTFGAHAAALPDVDWPQVSRAFVEDRLGLTWNPLTTQIESHDWQAELYADVARFNRVLHNLCTDVWSYISLGYFAQVRGQGTVGSSTMPHKVNPIRFENAEANLEVSNALLDVLASTLVTSRLQRDLTDSSMQRNIGTAFGHSLLAIDNAARGLAGLDAVPATMAADLDANWEVLGEPIQSAMRALGAQGVPGMDKPYERLKELTRGRRINGEDLAEFVKGLGLPSDVEARFLEMTPRSYVGLAPRLVDYLDVSSPS